MPSKWVEHIKDYAKSNGMTYRDALKDPKCKSSYHSSKGKGLEPMGIKEGEENIQMVIAEKKRRGRPPKYETEEERKKAKSLKTVESNKRKKTEKGKMSGEGNKRPFPDDPKNEREFQKRRAIRNKLTNIRTEHTNLQNRLTTLKNRLQPIMISFRNEGRARSRGIDNELLDLLHSLEYDLTLYNAELVNYTRKLSDEEFKTHNFNNMEDETIDIIDLVKETIHKIETTGELDNEGAGLKMSGEGGGMSKEQIEIARREEARRNGTDDAVTRLVTENMAGLENTEWTARFAELSKEDKLRYRRLLKQAQDKRQKEEDLEERMKKGKGKGKGIKKTVLKKEKAIENELIGKGILSAGYKAEHTNGLGHIYPISHDLILQMLKQYD